MPNDATAGLAGTILVIDDERNIRRTLRMVLEGEGATVLDAETAEQGLALIEASVAGKAAGEPAIQVVMADVLLPGMSGLQLLEKLSVMGGGVPPLPVILISGHATVSDAVRATRLGAFDFFEKPLARDRVVVSVRNALRHHAAEEELRGLRAKVVRHELIGESKPMQELLRQVTKVGATRARVLIEGESGTGKELVARAIHEASERRDKPFIKVNCAAIPKELIESELFGHERGAFTGATGQKKGLFELAHGGTLFLDEIGDMDLNAQSKVLRVLQSGELMRVGGEKPIKVEVRVLAATHRNLKEQVQTGEFREDLYFRLAVVPITVPPLRDRPGGRGAAVPALPRRRLPRERHLAEADLAGGAGGPRRLRVAGQRPRAAQRDGADGDPVGGGHRHRRHPDRHPRRGRGRRRGAGRALVPLGEGAMPPGMSLKAFRDSVSGRSSCSGSESTAGTCRRPRRRWTSSARTCTRR
jgi:two-component system nitrogen regulation response regulator NtrX